MNKIEYFLGANSDKGFVSYFEQLQAGNSDLQLLILKGGPGSGKSSLMKKVAKYAKGLGHDIEYIRCASDPDSLDAIIDQTAGFAMMDGTSPHISDPSVPGVLQHIMYTGDLWDCKKLGKHKKEILNLNEKISCEHKAATAYIKSASALLTENYNCAKKHIKRNDIYAFAAEITDMLPLCSGGVEKKRLLSAVSVGKTVFLEDTIKNISDKIYSIEDPWGCASDYLLNTIKGGALGKGVDVITCRCSVMPEVTEHIVIPSAKLAITRSNEFHRTTNIADAALNGLYTPMDNLSEMYKRTELASIIIDDAAQCIKKAKELHDVLEEYYINAMDFSLADKLFDNIIKRFL